LVFVHVMTIIIMAACCKLMQHMPSLYEGLPVAGVEAQANGLPLIVSNTITQELKITDAVEYIGLDEKTSKWCEVIERYNGYKRKNTRMEITNAGFNIDDTAIRLERIYLS
jgi:glycosyltransferase involved in cell wall biosynthesis